MNPLDSDGPAVAAFACSAVDVPYLTNQHRPHARKHGSLDIKLRQSFVHFIHLIGLVPSFTALLGRLLRVRLLLFIFVLIVPNDNGSLLLLFLILLLALSNEYRSRGRSRSSPSCFVQLLPLPLLPPLLHHLHPRSHHRLTASVRECP
jgi:hypothetical protein